MENRQRQGISLTSGAIGSDKLKIFVDADACSVVKIVEQVVKKYGIPCTLFLSLIKKGDICVTQDYGVAAMILGKGAVTI